MVLMVVVVMVMERREKMMVATRLHDDEQVQEVRVVQVVPACWEQVETWEQSDRC